MKRSTRSKQLMMLFLILLVASSSFYTKYSREKEVSSNAIVSGQKQHDAELKKLTMIQDGLKKSSIPEKKAESLKDAQVRFVYWIQEKTIEHSSRLDKFEFGSKNLDGNYAPLTNVPKVSSLPVEMAFTSSDYEKTKKFLDEMRHEFPIRIEALEVRYPVVTVRLLLLGAS